jgi:hypothetical protein
MTDKIKSPLVLMLDLLTPMGSKITVCTPKSKVFNVQWKGKNTRKRWVKIPSPRRASRIISRSATPVNTTSNSTRHQQEPEPIWDDMAEQYTYEGDNGQSSVEQITFPRTMVSAI